MNCRSQHNFLLNTLAGICQSSRCLKNITVIHLFINNEISPHSWEFWQTHTPMQSKPYELQNVPITPERFPLYHPSETTPSSPQGLWPVNPQPSHSSKTDYSSLPDNSSISKLLKLTMAKCCFPSLSAYTHRAPQGGTQTWSQWQWSHYFIKLVK